MTPSIILVEDDVRLAELVSRYLESYGFCVSVADLGGSPAEQIRLAQPDLVILDLGLPSMDGFAICRQLRPVFAEPILILTARNSDIDHVLGLELGADDYVTKPVEPRVLLARINALFRRSRHASAAKTSVLRFGGLTIDGFARSVTLSGKRVGLSASEFELLAYLAAHAGVVQSREPLFRALYKREYDGMDRMMDVRISHLRRKLGDEIESSDRIKTIWGQGYLFVAGAW